ncbi:MAG: hypothetical protein K2P71_12455 [Lachnospiraceae bacterium]|nr:hypothetical protein [Lachnospiraceae bacterium]
MKKFNLIPPFLMLLSGAVVSIVMYIRRSDTTELLIWVLCVMLFFYLAGCVIQNRLTFFVNQIKVQEEAEAAKEAERLQKEAEEEITNTDENIAEA